MTYEMNHRIIFLRKSILQILLCVLLVSSALGQSFGLKQKIGDPFIAECILNSKDEPTLCLDSLEVQILVFNFWNIGCLGCLQEMPHLNEVHGKFMDPQKIRFISVTGSGGPKLTSYLQKHPIEWDVILERIDFMGLGGYELFEIRSMPTTMIVGRDRKIKYIYSGVIDETTVAFLDALR